MMIMTRSTGNRTKLVHQRCSYLRCMKNITTIDALIVAIRRPTMMLPQCPRSTSDTATVTAVPTATAASTFRYVLLWSSEDMSPPSVEQVNDGEQEDPDQVDEVPVQRQVFDGRVM